MTLRGNRRRAQSWPALGQAPSRPQQHPFGKLPGITKPASVEPSTKEAPCPSGNVTGCPLASLRYDLARVTQAQQTMNRGREYL